MKPYLFYIKEETLERLKAGAGERGISVAEVIREAIDEKIDGATKPVSPSGLLTHKLK